MAKTILRRLAFLGCVFLSLMTLWPLVPISGYNAEYSVALPLLLYFVATGLTIAAIERPALDQRFRYPGAILNVIAVAFPIAILARWMNGDPPLQGFLPIIPVAGFSGLAAALLWVLEVDKVFRPTKRLAIIVGIVTLFAVAIGTLEPDPAGQDYASYLRALDRLATVVGSMYVIVAALWLYFLYMSVKRLPEDLLARVSPLRTATMEQQAVDSGRSVQREKASPSGGLMLEECRHCGTRVLFTKEVCPHCRQPR